MTISENQSETPSPHLPTWLIWSLILVSFVGFLDASYLTIAHYTGLALRCTVFNGCEQVTPSQYSEIFGIPVSILGLITYVYLFVFAIASLKNKSWAKKLLVPTLAFTLGGLGFSLYLTYIEFFVLYAVCIFCLTQQLFILSISILLSLSVWHSKKISN